MSTTSKTMYVFLVVLAIACQLSHAHVATPEEFLVAHNTARSRDNVGPIEWSEELCKAAAAHVEKMKGKCEMIPSGGDYGENMATGPGDQLVADVVQKWVDEKGWYNYSANTCNSGKDCSHYTQVVWANSKKLGCAKTKCNNGGTAIVCFYEPMGNYMGERPF
ncbi:hypothetical protein ACFE04_019286 [Oxalis oulophora]